MKHKWYNEIVAWASGAKIEYKNRHSGDWIDILCPRWNCASVEYRIKPQPKEPQYLHVYLDKTTSEPVFEFETVGLLEDDYFKYMGKIKLEQNDD